MDALEAARQLHREIQDWVARTGVDPEQVEWWGRRRRKPGGIADSGQYPLAQIAWLSGPRDWPADLLEGRSLTAARGRFAMTASGITWSRIVRC